MFAKLRGQRKILVPLPGGVQRDDQRELYLTADNDATFYRQFKAPYEKNLGRKFLKGQYDPRKAEHGYERGLYGYTRSREFHQVEGNWKPSINVRRAVARRFRRDFEAEAKAGNFQV